MASNLSCVGLDVPDEQAFVALIESALPEATPLGTRRGTTVLRWEDPSGARLVLTLRGGDFAAALPSFAGAPGARLRNVVPLDDEVFAADVVVDDETTTRAALELEQGPLLPSGAGGAATIVALGLDVQVFADEATFAASEASLLGGDDGEAPPLAEEAGILWPLRLSAESFVSHGLFAADEPPTAHAWLAGVVLAADRRSVDRTGQRFVAARVRSTGFETDVCLPEPEHVDLPSPGQVIAGTVFLVASLDEVEEHASRGRGRWLRRR